MFLLKETFLFHLHLACRFYSLIDYVDLAILNLPAYYSVLCMWLPLKPICETSLDLKYGSPPIGWDSELYIHSTISKAPTLATNFYLGSVPAAGSYSLKNPSQSHTNLLLSLCKLT